jgi:predicted TIM-barrel fold metal-dependent hydrolase
MCFTAQQLPLAVELADSCPDTTLILNHCGVPDIANDAFEPWHINISELAQRQNVVCKLSGLTAYCAEDRRSLTDIAPYVDHVLETFGPNRIVWGGDWPVVNLGSGLSDWIELTQQILSKLSNDEAFAIAQGTAKRIYGVQNIPS